MAFVSQSNNRGNGNEGFSPTVRSKYSFINTESQIDKSRLSFSMWKNTLQIIISPVKETPDGIQIDKDNSGSIYINHTKARIFAEELKKFLQDPDTYHGSAVFSGKAVISISNGSDVGGTSPILIIRNIDESGKAVGTFAYEFRTNFHCAIHNYNGDSNFNREYYPNIEIEELITMLEEYYRAASSAYAFMTVDAYSHNHNYMSDKLNQIAQKLGIEGGYGRSSGTRYNNTASNFFNGVGGNSSTAEDSSFPSATIDDIY